ncbi:MAG: hypothetical protein ACYDCO_06690 [Armatimonadota bacterium]
MSINLPNPYDVARAEAAKITADPKQYLDGPFERLQLDSPFVDWPAVVAGLTAFHQERMAKIPSSATYPEAQPWVEHALAVDRELQALAGLSDEQMACYRSLKAYLTFRGFKSVELAPTATPPLVTEKCRAVYLPDTDQGQLHVKNVDDPLTFWKPNPNPAARMPQPGPLRGDGVGAGLHIDDEPAEIFPLNPKAMMLHFVDDVPGVVQFLTRYSPFWGSANNLYYDAQKRCVAIEKTSYNFIDVYGPDPCGGVHISGMVCRNPESAQAKYVAAKRQEFLRKFNRPEDCPDNAYWNGAMAFEKRLGDFTNRPASPTVAETLELFTAPTPRGFNKWGAKFHRDQGYLQYTLIVEAFLHDARKIYRWQRDAFGVFPCIPEVYEIS